MPRQPRKLSESGYMHLIIRGIGQQILFEEEQDYRYFLKILERYCLETSVKMCAYCLMENHVHMLVLDEKHQIPILMKKLGVSYAMYFNKKYERKGHLFQDRYLGEAVENEAYLLVAFRYILNNPRKAGICAASKYPWNSYGLYDLPPSYFDLTLVRDLLGNDESYAKFIEAVNNDSVLEYDGPKHDDNWAMETVQRCLGVKSGTEIQTYEKEKRNEALKKLKDSGLSIRQIERLTGINRNIIQRI